MRSRSRASATLRVDMGTTGMFEQSFKVMGKAREEGEWVDIGPLDGFEFNFVHQPLRPIEIHGVDAQFMPKVDVIVMGKG